VPNVKLADVRFFDQKTAPDDFRKPLAAIDWAQTSTNFYLNTSTEFIEGYSFERITFCAGDRRWEVRVLGLSVLRLSRLGYFAVKK
jgi:hypothetical protein